MENIEPPLESQLNHSNINEPIEENHRIQLQKNKEKVDWFDAEKESATTKNNDDPDDSNYNHKDFKKKRNKNQ